MYGDTVVNGLQITYHKHPEVGVDLVHLVVNGLQITCRNTLQRAFNLLMAL